MIQTNCPFVPKLIDFGKDLFEKDIKSYIVELYVDELILKNFNDELNEDTKSTFKNFDDGLNEHTEIFT